MGINNLYVSQNDPKLFKGFVSTSTRGKSGDFEVVLTFYISMTGKSIIAELKAYQGYKIIAKCSVKRNAADSLNTAVREASKTLLNIAGFSEVPLYIPEIDYRQAKAFIRHLLPQLIDVKPYYVTIDVTHNWRFA